MWVKTNGRGIQEEELLIARKKEKRGVARRN